MATTRQRSIRHALEEIVACSMCMERLKNPKILQCQHSACSDCLIQWNLVSDSAICDHQYISCPTCRKLTSLPPDGVAGLPGDFNKNILLDILDTAEADGGMPGCSRTYCTVCDITGRIGMGAKTPATAFCTDCQDHLCSPCLVEHNSLPLLADHAVVVTPHGSHLSVLMCRDHRNKSLDFFCHSCSKLVCTICIRTDHRDHVAEGSAVVSETRKRDIAQQKSALEAKLVALRASSRAYSIDRRASAAHRVATFTSYGKNSFDTVSTKVMLESLHQFCEYLLHKADPGEVVAAADHVRNCTQTLLAQTAPDEFTDRILALIANYKTDASAILNRVRRGGGGSVASDDKSSDLTDDASAVGSEPGGAVTDLDDAEDDYSVLREEGSIEVDDTPSVGHQHVFEGESAVAVEVEDGPETRRVPDLQERPSDVSQGEVKLAWRCSTVGPAIGEVDGPWDVCFTSDGHVITTEAVNNRVQIFGEGGANPRILLEGFEPRGVSVSRDGTIAVVDHTKHCVRLLPPGGDSSDVIEWKPQNMAAPEVMAFARDGCRVVTDAGKHTVSVYDPNGRYLHTFGERGHGSGQFRQPVYVSVSPEGKVVVGDLHNNRIQAFTVDGQFLWKAGKLGPGKDQLRYPRGVCWDGSGHVLVGDSNNNRVTVFDGDGRWVRHLLTEQHGQKKIRGVSVTSSGLPAQVAITDRDNEYSSLTVWSL